MKHIRIRLLGSFQVTINDYPITQFDADTARALLAYLALNAERPHQREALATLLWNRQSKEDALGNLRSALNRLRKALSDKHTAHPFLLVTRGTIQFNPNSDFWCDTRALQSLVDQVKRHPHRSLNGCPWCISRLRKAAELYRGPFLADLYIDSYPFEEWQRIVRERFHRMGISVLYALASYHQQRGEYTEAEHYARQQIILEPWREEAHQQLMRALFASGQRSAALAQYQALRVILQEELGVLPMEETTALYEEIRAAPRKKGVTGELYFQKPGILLQSSPSLFPNNLPVQGTPFFGREREIDVLLERLVVPNNRLTTLVGPGGVGKTRLALVVAQALLGSFKDGVWFVNLAEVEAPEDPLETQRLIAAHIADALNFPIVGQADPKERILAHLQDKEMLLVLDNIEHLMAGTALINDLLNKAPHVSLLITSRSALKFQNEFALRLHGLTVPEQATDPMASQASAVKLFVERANRSPQGFTLTPDNISQILHICHLVQGLPLGIELAAVWAGYKPLSKIASEIKNNLDFLATNRQDVPVRQRSLRAVFEGSWQLLSTAEQQALMMASIFQGGFSEEAGRAVLRDHSALLESLVEQSLVRHSKAGRYEMHNTVRQFAQEKLDEAAYHSLLESSAGHLENTLKATIYQRHSAYYLNLLKETQDDLFGANPKAALVQLREEIGNIQQAWDWASNHRAYDLMLDAMAALSRFYLMTGSLKEGESVFGSVLDAHRNETGRLSLPPEDLHPVFLWLLIARASFLRRISQYEQAEENVQTAIDFASLMGEKTAQVAGFLEWGWLRWQQNDLQESEKRFRRAFNLAQKHHLPSLEAESLQGLGIVRASLGHYNQAREYFQQALFLFQDLGDRWGESQTISSMGMLLYDQGAYADAEGYIRQALAFARELGDLYQQGKMLNDLGTIVSYLGKYDQAQEHFEQALPLAKASGDRQLLASVQYNIGRSLIESGRYAQARVVLTEAIPIAKSIHDRHLESQMYILFGKAAYLQGKLTEASQAISRSLHIARSIQDPHSEMWGLFHAGVLDYLRQRDEKSVAYCQQALELARALQDRNLEAYIHLLLGYVHERQEQLQPALDAYRKSQTVRENTLQPAHALEPTAAIASVLHKQGEVADACSYARKVSEHLAQVGVFGGWLMPFQVYWSCYQVLHACLDPQAEDILSQAYRLLQERAEAIEEDSLRHSFFVTMPAVRDILAAWERAALQGVRSKK